MVLWVACLYIDETFQMSFDGGNPPNKDKRWRVVGAFHYQKKTLSMPCFQDTPSASSEVWMGGLLFRPQLFSYASSPSPRSPYLNMEIYLQSLLIGRAGTGCSSLLYMRIGDFGIPQLIYKISTDSPTSLHPVTTIWNSWVSKSKAPAGTLESLGSVLSFWNFPLHPVCCPFHSLILDSKYNRWGHCLHGQPFSSFVWPSTLNWAVLSWFT